MNIWHPLDRIPDGRPMLAAFAVLFILETFTMFKTAAKLKTTAAPCAAISLELAGSERRAKEIINSWEKEGLKSEAYRHLRWDAAFIVFYSTLVSLGCVMAARAFFGRGTTAYGVALALAWLPWLAGLLDYVENNAMYAMLDSFSGESLPRRAWWCAAVKFALIVPLGAYALCGAIWYIVGWLRGTIKVAA